MSTNLTDDFITALSGDRGKCSRKEYSDAIEPGLRIRVGARVCAWSLLVRDNAEARRINLGIWPKVTVDHARAAAREFRRREAAHSSVRTVDELLELYDVRKARFLKRGPGTLRALRDILSDLRHIDLQKVTRRHVADAIAEKARYAPIQANRQLAYTKALFSWAVGQGLMFENPARNIPKPAREEPRERTPSLAELAAIWRACGELTSCYGHIVRLLMLTGCRASDVAGMRRCELDLPQGVSDGVWTIPASRTKNNRAIRVPLSPLARSEIESALDKTFNDQWVFSPLGEVPFSGWSKAKTALDKKLHQLGESAVRPWRLHDLRRSLATIACDQLDTPDHVVDRCLNHVGAGTASAVRRIYGRSEFFNQRRTLLNDWADLIQAELDKGHQSQGVSHKTARAISPDQISALAEQDAL